jgi:hypothetical protein
MEKYDNIYKYIIYIQDKDKISMREAQTSVNNRNELTVL